MHFPVVAVALLVCTASAQTQTVHRVPQDHATIQQAINASADGDTVRVAPGEYFERLAIARRITLESSDGPQNTIVDATFLGPVLTISGVGRDTVVQGLTLTHGRDLGKAGGIAIVDASPTIRSNHIVDNLGGQLGNGISAENSSALIESNRIAGNINTGVVGGGGGAGGIGLSGLRCEADPQLCAAEIRGNLIENNIVDSFDFGGGIAVYGGRPRIIGNLIRHNRARSGGGIVVLYDEGAQIENNLLVGNQSSAASGGGIYLGTSLSNRGPQIVNNTLVDNQAVGGGSGIFADVRVSTVRVVNNLIVGASSGAIECGGFSTMPPLVAYNNAVAATGPAYAGLCATALGRDGNLSVAPSFVAPGDYRLRSGSAGIDAGSNDYSGEPVDLVGSPRIVAVAGAVATVDIGAYELSDLLFAGDFEPGTLLSADAAWTNRPMFARQYE